MVKGSNDIAVETFALKTLLYYDIFNYPLKEEEIFRFLRADGIAQQEVRSALQRLINKTKVFYSNGFYSVQRSNDIIQRRVKGNAEAQRLMPVAMAKARLIASFPFVRGVLASGSLSKNYMDENSDLDFFVITAPDRLWLARTLLVLYKRIFLRNSHKHFCINYFLDADHLEIEEKNLFTATELATVIPLYNFKLYQHLIASNPWLREAFPNFNMRADESTLPESRILTKIIAEWLLNVFGKLPEKSLSWLTLLRWRRIYGAKYSAGDFKIAFKTKRYVSKNHPRNYQKFVMELYHKKLEDYANKHNIIIQP